MTAYVEVAVNVPQVTGVFHYHLPPHLEGQVEVGCLVVAPFGRQHVQGVVLRYVDEPSVAETRPLVGVIDSQAMLTQAQIRLVEHLAEESLSPLGAWVGLMLPPGLSQQVDTLYAAGTNFSYASSQRLGKTQARLLALVAENGSLRGRQLDRLLSHVNWRAAAVALVRKNFLTAQSVLPLPGVKPRMARTVALAVPPEAAEATLAQVGRADSAAHARRQAIVRFLMHAPGAVNVTWVYAESGGTASDLRKLAELGLLRFGEGEAMRDPLEGLDCLPSTPPLLTQDQQVCWQAIQVMLNQAAAGREVRSRLFFSPFFNERRYDMKIFPVYGL